MRNNQATVNLGRSLPAQGKWKRALRTLALHTIHKHLFLTYLLKESILQTEFLKIIIWTKKFLLILKRLAKTLIDKMENRKNQLKVLVGPIGSISCRLLPRKKRLLIILLRLIPLFLNRIINLGTLVSFLHQNKSNQCKKAFVFKKQTLM